MRKWIALFEAAHPLPAPGEKPWWIAALAKLTKVMKKEHADMGWGWTTGGCFAFAEALHAAYGGELWSFCSYAEDMDDYEVQHGVLKVGQTYYDYNGVFDPVKFAKTMLRSGFILKGQKVEMLPADSNDGYYWQQDEFFDDEGIATLSRILKTGQ